MSDSKFTFPFVDGNETMALGIVLPITCLIVVAIRFYMRNIQKAGIGIDDWLALAGLSQVVIMGGFLIAGAHLKTMGYPTPPPPANLTPEEQASYIAPSTKLNEKLIFPFQIFMMLAYFFIKTSIVAFYRRLFVAHKRTVFDWMTKVMLVLIPLWALAFILLVIFSCGSRLWANWGSQADQAKYCPAAFKNEYGFAISDLILDAFIFLMPLPLIWKLNLSINRKLAVSGIILLGASAVGASIARLVIYVQGLKAVTTATPIDINQLITVSYWWSMLECGLALIASCLPTMSYLFKHYNVKGHYFRSLSSLFKPKSSASNTSERTLNRKYGTDHDNDAYVELDKERKNSRGPSQDAIVRKDSWEVEWRTPGAVKPEPALHV